MTAVTASTPPADAIAPSKRHRRHRERGVLSLVAIGAVALLWLGLDVPGLKLAPPKIARDETGAPVVANLAVEGGGTRASRTVTSAGTPPARHAHDVRRPRVSTRASTIVVSARRATTDAPAPKPAPGEPVTPTAQPPQVSAASPAPAIPLSSLPSPPPPAPAPPAAAAPVPVPIPVPVEAPPVVSQVVTTAVATATTATSDVTDATQQVTSTLPGIPPLHP